MTTNSLPHAALLVRLSREWRAISHRPTVLRRARTWQLGVAFVSLDDIVAAAGWRRVGWARLSRPVPNLPPTRCWPAWCWPLATTTSPPEWCCSASFPGWWPWRDGGRLVRRAAPKRSTSCSLRPGRSSARFPSNAAVPTWQRGCCAMPSTKRSSALTVACWWSRPRPPSGSTALSSPSPRSRRPQSWPRSSPRRTCSPTVIAGCWRSSSRVVRWGRWRRRCR